MFVKMLPNVETRTLANENSELTYKASAPLRFYAETHISQLIKITSSFKWKSVDGY